uniref:Uncharacterized protein n=1 Tax=Lygus hesperus TaxID=30085 RepID=A0A0A9X737_LYGHE
MHTLTSVDTMLFPKPLFVLWCFFYASSESLQTKLKSNLQNNYTKQKFNVSPGLSDQLKSEIPVTPVASVWPNKEVGRDFDGRTLKHGSKKKMKKDSQIEPKTKKSSTRISNFQRFGISYSRTTLLKTATTKKGGGEGRLPKYGTKPGQIGSPQIETADKDSQQFRRFGLSGSSNKTKKNAKSIKK